MTSIELTRFSTRICVLGELSMDMALALPRSIMVVFLHLEMRMDWLSETSISIGFDGLSWFSISHLLPSNSFFGSLLGVPLPAPPTRCCEALLFCRILGGFGLISGPGLRDRLIPSAVAYDFSGTAPLARRSGFLCVIWLLSTFFNPEVTDSPRFSCANTEPISPAEPSPFCAEDAEDEGGWLSKFGNGGGGGGGAPLVPEVVEGVGGDLTPLVVEEAIEGPSSAS